MALDVSDWRVVLHRRWGPSGRLSVVDRGDHVRLRGFYTVQGGKYGPNSRNDASVHWKGHTVQLAARRRSMADLRAAVLTLVCDLHDGGLKGSSS